MKLKTVMRLALEIGLFTAPAFARTPTSVTIAPAPPVFRIYDVDRREAWLRRTLAALAGTSALSRPRADAELARLERIREREAALKSRDGGALRTSDLQALNAELTDVARRAGLR